MGHCIYLDLYDLLYSSMNYLDLCAFTMMSIKTMEMKSFCAFFQEWSMRLCQKLISLEKVNISAWSVAIQR